MLCVEIWNDLGADRSRGFGDMGCIPWTALDRMWRRYGYDDDSFTIVWRVIRILDRDRIDREESKRKLNS